MLRQGADAGIDTNSGICFYDVKETNVLIDSDGSVPWLGKNQAELYEAIDHGRRHQDVAAAGTLHFLPAADARLWLSGCWQNSHATPPLAKQTPL